MNLEDVLLRGTRAAQPAANTLAEGTLYFVTDELKTEQSRAGAWVSWTDGGASGITALTGEVTATGPGSVAATIANDAIVTAKVLNDAITYAKLQNISATQRILARKTAGAGDVEEATLSEILDFITSAAQGDILYRDAAAWARLAAGTNGHYLQTQGAGANPQWAAVAAGGGDVTKVRLAITEGQLETMFSAPVTIVAAAGADKIIVPIFLFWELDITGGYTNTPSLSLFYAGGSQNLMNGAALAVSWNVTGKRYAFLTGNTSYQFTYASFDPRNKALQLKLAADLTGTAGGAATAVANLLYSTITVT